MKNIGMKAVLFILVGVAVIAPFGVLAQANPIGTIDPGGIAVGIGDPVSGSIDADTLITKITTLVNWFAWFVALVSVVMGLYAGFLFITARGEPAQLKTARQTLVWAVIGIAVAVLAFSIITITKSIFTL